MISDFGPRALFFTFYLSKVIADFLCKSQIFWQSQNVKLIHSFRLIINLVLYGRPATKKNSQRIAISKNGRRFIIQSKRYVEYEKSCLWKLKSQYKGETIMRKVSIKLLYYLKDKRLPDLLNLEQATCDILEKARVIDNDRNIVSFDGSRIAGIDKDNPRCEIEIKGK